MLRLIRVVLVSIFLAWSGASVAGAGLCLQVDYVEGVNGNGEPDMVPVLSVFSDNDEKWNCPFWFIPLASEETESSGFPELSPEEMAQLMAALIGLFVVAACVRVILKQFKSN